MMVEKAAKNIEKEKLFEENEENEFSSLFYFSFLFFLMSKKKGRFFVGSLL